MKSKPEKIHNVSSSQFSVARYYGGISINGTDYVYDEKDDTLTRIDLCKRKKK